VVDTSGARKSLGVQFEADLAKRASELVREISEERNRRLEIERKARQAAEEAELVRIEELERKAALEKAGTTLARKRIASMLRAVEDGRVPDGARLVGRNGSGESIVELPEE